MQSKYLFLLFLFLTFNATAQEKLELFFDFGKDVPNESSIEELNNWLKKEKRTVVYKIEGYCDYVDTDEYNKDLSLRRVKNVLALLDSNILDTHKTEIIGVGENFEQSPQQEKNRKVLIYYDFVTPKLSKPVEPIVESKLSKQITESNVGDKLKLEDLNFYNMSDVVVLESRPILADLLQIMKANENLKIEIQGHICCMPKDIYQTAKLRAVAVYNYLVHNGIDKDRLSYVSFGSSKPIYPLPEKNEQEREANRRVEIMVVNK